MKTLRGNKTILGSLGLVALGALISVLLQPIVGSAATLNLRKGQAPLKLPAGSPALTLQNAFIQVAASVSPAVVNISSEWTENVRGMDDLGNMDDFFNFWFYGPQGGQRRHAPMKQKQRSLGSGFLISEDGYILTNGHVLGKASKVTVTFEDGTTYSAKVVGKAEGVDIGVIKIDAPGKRFPFVTLGDSDALQVGEWAIAIGNPFALDHTVTTGIISAKGRSVRGLGGQESGYQNYIQTDASINPGNSGGPLCNIEGEVVGINTAIYSQSGGSIGIGFAIPSNMARKAAEDLVNEGRVVRAGLGAMVQELTPQMAKSFGLSTTEGALLSNISKGSAAEKAGLKAGDIVLSINGAKVTGSGDLIAKLYTYKPGDTVEVAFLRDGNRGTASVKLQALSQKPAQKDPSSDEGDEEGEDLGDRGLGLAFQDQTPELKGRLPEGAPQGPVVLQVQRGTPAAAAGLQPGDVILKAGNQAIYTAKQLSAILKKSDMTKGLRLFVWRDGATLYTFLQNGD